MVLRRSLDDAGAVPFLQAFAHHPVAGPHHPPITQILATLIKEPAPPPPAPPQANRQPTTTQPSASPPTQLPYHVQALTPPSVNPPVGASPAFPVRPATWTPTPHIRRPAPRPFPSSRADLHHDGDHTADHDGDSDRRGAASLSPSVRRWVVPTEGDAARAALVECPPVPPRMATMVADTQQQHQQHQHQHQHQQPPHDAFTDMQAEAHEAWGGASDWRERGEGDGHKEETSRGRRERRGRGHRHGYDGGGGMASVQEEEMKAWWDTKALTKDGRPADRQTDRQTDRQRGKAFNAQTCVTSCRRQVLRYLLVCVAFVLGATLCRLSLPDEQHVSNIGWVP